MSVPPFQASFDSNNLEYIDSLYQSFLQNSSSVTSEWQAFFKGMEFSKTPQSGEFKKEMAALKLVNTYRRHGHLKADLNPLESKSPQPSFNFSEFGLTLDDLSTQFQCLENDSSLSTAISRLESQYCQKFSADFSHCSEEISQWMQNKIEACWSLSEEEKKQSFTQLCGAAAFENILHKKYVGAKRFSVEGVDVLIPMMYHLKKKSLVQKIPFWVLGMSHRGRLSLCANLLEKSKYIFTQFEGNFKFPQNFTGDVKYHLGYSENIDSKLNVNLLSNPSHLEVITPVICGFARSIQNSHLENCFNSCLPIVIHGDSAFTGQGVVAETLQMSELPSYTVGGTLHIILNNQLGFTATQKESKSSHRTSDIMKSIDSPILLANADCLESCLKAIEIAFNFRNTFHKDCCVEIIGYRRYGHNEGDEPSFTQPLMYQKITTHKRSWQIYGQQLCDQNILTDEDISSIYKSQEMKFSKNVQEVQSEKPQVLSFLNLQSNWKNFPSVIEDNYIHKTTTTFVSKQTLESLQKVLFQLPKNFNLNPKIQKQIDKQKELLNSGFINWALSETLAFASLRHEGYSIRLSGQDSIRGTFSHRHAGFYDTKTQDLFIPLKQINPSQGFFGVHNSLLSEEGVLGFEYGLSIQDPQVLNIWEAQFGDFSNGAQIIIDQFLSSGETKWGYRSGLTLFLPHGQEGQGPEHSSCRLERYLQLCAENNIQVCHLSTAANFFHLLRRQMLRSYRKPLIVLTPKSKLRSPFMNSSLSELTNSGFQEILCDDHKKDSQIKTLFLCSGKFYLDLKSYWQKKPLLEHVAVARLEQIYPFPASNLSSLIQSFSGLKRLIWIQEEPKNMGAWPYVQSQFLKLINDLNLDLTLHYCGRRSLASTAEGSLSDFETSQKQILEAFYKERSVCI